MPSQSRTFPALTELQNSVMWANAAIAIHEDKPEKP